MKSTLIILVWSIVILIGCLNTADKDAPDTIPLKQSKMEFSYDSVSATSDTVKLKVSNRSEKTLYYSIGVSGLTDTGWVGLTPDINSLGSELSWGLTTILPMSSEVRPVSKERIFYLYDYKNIARIRFSLMYFEEREITDKFERIDLAPIGK